jgi:hypothetical protein
MLVLRPNIVDAGCPKMSPAESTPATIGNLLWLYGFEKVRNEWPKCNLFEFILIISEWFPFSPWNSHPLLLPKSFPNPLDAAQRIALTDIENLGIDRFSGVLLFPCR